MMDDAMHEAVREALLDLEPDEVLDAAQAAHLEGCEECQAFAHALRSVDDQLAELPSFEAPAALVERTRSAIAEQPREREPSRGTLGLFGALLAGILSGLGALLGLLFAPFRGKSHGPWAIALPAVAAVVVVVVGGIGTLGYRSEPESASVDDAVEPGELNDRLAQMVFEDSVADEEESTEEPNGWDEAAVGGDSGGTGHRGNGQIGQMLGGEGGRGPRGLFWGADGDDDGVILDGRGERDRDGRFDVDLPTTSGTTAVVNGAIEAPAMEESSRVAQGYGPQLRALGYADQEDIEQAPPANWRAVEEDAEGEVAPAGRPAFTTLTTTSSRDTSTLLPLRDEERTEG
ncbi:MAG: hypothetical protein KC619_07160, partial [Myxococcales bacterium]|nr:hypothetical protein [Myxococcales bacterium]